MYSSLKVRARALLPALAATMILLTLVTLVVAPSSSGATTRAALVPSTSLDTLPVVYMGGNSAARPAEKIEMLS